MLSGATYLLTAHAQEWPRVVWCEIMYTVTDLRLKKAFFLRFPGPQHMARSGARVVSVDAAPGGPARVFRGLVWTYAKSTCGGSISSFGHVQNFLSYWCTIDN